MKVLIENEKLYAFMVKNRLNVLSMADKCEISPPQTRQLLRCRHMNINTSVAIRVCNNTGFRFSSIFTVLEQTDRDQLGLNILRKYYDDANRLTDIKIG